MEPSIPMILPKGIVINTTNIYKEVASYPIIPADKIWEYWHVYTTTHKKLKDPTARRLENFWWQVWGSDRRFLSGRALAKLYEDISLGPTIVPLHGPPNRWEGPGVPPLTKQLIVAHLNRGIGENQQPPGPLRTRSNEASIKSLSSSASKPPPSHPILKKARSPFAAGPRPTARFVSPPGSDDEGAKDSDIPSSASTATTGLEMPISTKAPPLAKSSTLDVAKAKKRPVVNQKLGPQASNALSQASSRDAAVASAMTRGLTQLRTVSPVPERTMNMVASEPVEATGGISSRSPTRPVVLSAKAAGKQPMVPRNAPREGASTCQQKPRPSVSTSLANSRARTTPDLRSPASIRSLSLTQTDTDNSSTTGSVTDSISMTGRSLSQNGYSRKGSATQGLFTGALASTTNVAAKGQIIDQAGSLPKSGVVDPYTEEFGPLSRSSASLLESQRLVPTPPSHAASVPMGRTRSQLTLLLEREKSRIGDSSRSRH